MPQRNSAGPAKTADQILQELLERQAETSAIEVGISCRIGKRRPQPPRKSTFGEFWYRTSNNPDRILYHEGSVSKVVGIVQFTIYTPEALGSGHSTPMAERLKSSFERSILAKDKYFVLLGRLKAREFPSAYHGNFINIVDGSFRFFQPDR